MYLERETIILVIASYLLNITTDADNIMLEKWLQVEDNRSLFERITAEGYLTEQLTRLEYYQNSDELDEELLWNRINRNDK